MVPLSNRSLEKYSCFMVVIELRVKFPDRLKGDREQDKMLLEINQRKRQQKGKIHSVK